MESPIFQYFRGPVEEMASLADGENLCHYCDATGQCFEIQSDEKRFGCFECLRKGRFHFSHETEIGSVRAKSPFLSRDARHLEMPSDFNRAACGILLRTPRYVTWQGESWLTHCSDFMIYLGEWKPADFCKHALDGDGKKLFLEMTAKSSRPWNDATLTIAFASDDWNMTFYAFGCAHCGKYRGNWDCT